MCFLRKISLAIIATAAFAGLIFSQEEVHLQRWTTKDGLSSNKVNSICRGTNGYVWIGTNNGLNKFDGFTFKPFYSSNKKQFRISSNLVYAIKEDRAGNIWVATDKGLNRINPNNNTCVIFDQSTMGKIALPNTSIRSLLPDSNGIWLGCEARDLAFWDFQSNNIKTYPFISYVTNLFPILKYKLIYIANIEKISPEKYLIDANIGLFVFDKKNQRFDCIDNYLGFAQVRKAPLIPDFYRRSGANKILYHNLQNQLFNTMVVTESSTAYTDDPFVNCIVNANDTTAWLLTDNGLYLLDTRQHLVKKAKSGLFPTGQLNTYFKESSGNIWVGGTEGLWYAENNRKGFVHYKLLQEPGPGNHNLIDNILQDESKDKIYCPENYGLTLYTITPNQGVTKTRAEQELKLVRQTPDKSLWLAVGTSIRQRKPGTEDFTTFPIPQQVFDPKKKFRFTDVKQDVQGNYWFATNRDGFAVFHPKDRTWWKPTIKDSFISNYITKIDFCSKSNSSWIASDDYGLWNFDLETQKFKLYRPSEVKPSGTINSYVITDICKDQQGQFFFATFDGGFSSYDQQHKRFKHYTTNEGLSSNMVYALLADKKNRIWLATDRGIDCFNQTTKEISYFDQKDFGTNFHAETTLNATKGGKMAFGTKLGYIEFYPDSLIKRVDSKVMVASFKILDKEILDSIDLTQEIALSWLDNLIRLELATDHPAFDGKTRFAYRLIDQSSSWSKIESGNVLTLSYLPYGKHELWIKAIENGLESNQVLKIVLNVRPPFYRTTWFYCVVLLLLSLLVYAYIKLKVNRIKSEAEIRNTYNQQIAKIEMSALRAQMNPHFIFNCLNSINRFILVNDTDAASEYLTKFSRLIRHILDSSKSDYITLEKELNALKLYLELESMRFQDSFAFTVDVDDLIDTETINIPPLLLQPFAENAVWHGLMQSAPNHAKLLSIVISRTSNNGIKIEILDNGVGRHRATELQSKGFADRKSYGISLNQERLHLMNHANGTNSYIIVEDLQDEKGQALGTKVIIIIEKNESNIG